MTHTVLMMSSVPLAAPWNGADKNTARFIVNHDTVNHFIVHSTRETQWQHDRVRIVHSPSSDPMPTIAQKLRSFLYLMRHAPQADIVHIVTSFAQPSRLSIEMMRMWRRLYRSKVIHTIPSLGSSDLTASQFIADITVVVSEYARQRLRALGIRHVERIYPPLSATDFIPKLDPYIVQQQYKLGTNAILYPAHYGEKSGITTMIAAFAQIAPEHPAAILVFACRPHIGQDAQIEAEKVWAEAHQAGIASQVRLLDVVEDMPSLMQACTITALVPGYMASKMDLPLVILESLLLGKPVIVTDMPPMHEVLLGDCGFAVPYADVAALASALRFLLGDCENRHKMGKIGQSLVNRYCAPSHIIAQYQGFYARSP